LSSQYLKMIDRIPAWVSVTFKILDNNTGPNSLTVALNLVPSCSERLKISTGNPEASNGMLIFSCLSSILGWPGLGCAIPLKSPFKSISNTGIPLLLKFSAKT